MLLGPIFQVELVSTSRRGRYFALRVLYGLLILLVLWFSYETSQAFQSFNYEGQMSTQRSSQLASAFFHSFSYLQFLAILAAGPALASGTIASERERRTIEYLFVTDLSNFEIVVGKALARLLLLGKLIIVGLPILFIFRMLGGIPAGALVAVFLLSASSALLITSLGICVSVWSPKPRDAIVRSYVLLAALLTIPPIMDPLISSQWGGSDMWLYVLEPMFNVFRMLHPLAALSEALGNRWALGIGLDMSSVFSSVLWQTVVSLILLGWATLAVRRVHLAESSRGSKAVKVRSQFRLPTWKPRLGNRPMVWKEMFAGTAQTRLGFVGTIALLLILLMVFGSTIYAFVESVVNQNSGRKEDYIVFLAGLSGWLGTAILLLLANRAAGQVTSEIERDCWLSLLATPLTGGEIMTGKMLGNLYVLRWAIVVQLFAWGLGVLIDPAFIFAVGAALVTQLVLGWYVTNLGLVFSLHSKTTLRATGATVATLLFTGGGYLMCCCSVMMGSGGQDAFEVMLVPCIPFLLAAPPLGYLEMLNDNMYSSFDGAVPGLWLLGILFYGFVGFVLQVMMTARFDELVGRTTVR